MLLIPKKMKNLKIGTWRQVLLGEFFNANPE